jgi:23S rRNA (cytosine1962-C5)-methyltransferase
MAWNDDRAAALDRLLAASAPEAHTDTDCVRLCAGAVHGCPGLIVDRLGALVVATDYAPAGAGSGPGLLAALEARFASHDLIVKTRALDKGAFTIDRVARAAPLVARERGMRFEIGRDPAHDFGLYLDAAKARAWVRARASGAHVLNLFAYTGAFGVAAALGGASSVTNVDPNRDYLAWALRNAQLNDVAMRVLPDTAQVFLRRHLRRMARSPAPLRFDLVIVDPPAFGVGRGNDRILRFYWPELFASLRTMAPDRVLLLCNDKYLRDRTSFDALVAEALGDLYRFVRLGTHLAPRDLAQDRAGAPLDLRFDPGALAAGDPRYDPPVVLAGERFAQGERPRQRSAT